MILIPAVLLILMARGAMEHSVPLGITLLLSGVLLLLL